MNMTFAPGSAEYAFRWNGEDIRLDPSISEAFGNYDYTTQDRRQFVEFEVRPAETGVVTILRRLNGEEPPDALPATVSIDGAMRLLSPSTLTPHNVQEAILQVVVWAEWLTTRE